MPRCRDCSTASFASSCGIDPGTVERIFEPFFTTKALAHGTGLGLSVVHGIVTGHEGAITVESEPGHGTMFHLYFPAAATPADAQAGPAPAPIGHGERVLFVDDEDALVLLVRRALSRLGYRVSGYADAAEALHAFRTRPHDFDVVVSDLAMPGVSGYDLVREVLRIRADTPVVLMTGYIRPGDADAAARAGARELILETDHHRGPCPGVAQVSASIARKRRGEVSMRMRGRRAVCCLCLLGAFACAVAADLNGCVAFAVKPDGAGTLSNRCGNQLNVTYCVDNAASAKSCAKVPLAVTTLAREAFERLPSYTADGAGTVHWAVCAYPEAAVDWKPGPASTFACRKTCVMC